MMPTPKTDCSESGFTLVETLIAVLLLAGAFVAIVGAIPLASLIHRGALEREEALSLAQSQMEYFLTNPGPYPGQSGVKGDFVNAREFPSGFTGSYSASRLAAGSGLVVIVVAVTPPHLPMVEISAIDTTYSNVVAGGS
jgi:Tfp pilus assembly protein PilV